MNVKLLHVRFSLHEVLLFMLEVDFGVFPELHTKRLILKEITESDARELFALRSNESVMKYIDRPWPKDLEDTLVLIRKMHQMRIDGVQVGFGSGRAKLNVVFLDWQLR